MSGRRRTKEQTALFTKTQKGLKDATEESLRSAGYAMWLNGIGPGTPYGLQVPDWDGEKHRYIPVSGKQYIATPENARKRPGGNYGNALTPARNTFRKRGCRVISESETLHIITPLTDPCPNVFAIFVVYGLEFTGKWADGRPVFRCPVNLALFVFRGIMWDPQGHVVLKLRLAAEGEVVIEDKETAMKHRMEEAGIAARLPDLPEESSGTEETEETEDTDET